MTKLREPTEESWLEPRGDKDVRLRLLSFAGDGPPILLIHAASLCAGVWGPVLAQLDPGMPALAYDQRGHGDSDAPTDEASYDWDRIGEDFARVVEATQERFGEPPAACITHSFAGDCALMALARKSLPVGKMILLDPVLADQEGATVGAQRLAKGTRRLGEREAAGFESREAVGEALERVLKAQLAREGLDPAAKAAFARWGSAPDADGRLRLKCRRDNEAWVYTNRVAIADHLADKNVDAEVHLVFSKRRRAKPEDQEAAYARDWKVAEGVTSRCRTGAIHPIDGVGHFLVLEAPEVVAATIRSLL